MKKLLILFTFVVATHFSNAQNHSIGLSFGHIFDGASTNFASLEGASSYHFKNGSQFGFNYSYQLSKKFNIVSGFQFQQTNIQSQNGSSTGELQTWDFQVNNLNIPILAHLSFLKYLFIEVGPMLNFQTNGVDDYGIDNQSGIGFSLGLGIQYDMKKLNFFMKTQTQMNALIPFNSENYHDRLIANSLTIGVFYQL